MHQRHARFSVGRCENLLPRFILLEHRCPIGLEIDGIEQITHRSRINLFQNVRNHPAGLLIAPPVNPVERQWRTEIEGLSLGIIIVGHVLLEQLFQLVLIVHEDSISNIQLHLFVHMRQIVDKVLAIIVHGLDAALVEAQRLLQFLLGGARGAVVHHT